MRVAIVGTYPPRRCGIATFSRDLVAATVGTGRVEASVIALDDEPRPFPPEVIGRIRPSVPGDHAWSGDRLSELPVDVVSVQHEFGIFGGDDGEGVLDLVDRVSQPIVATLHTVLVDATRRQRRIIAHLAERSARIVVMSEAAADRLVERYPVAREDVEVIPHGVPDLSHVEPHIAKRLLGEDAGRPLVLSFGLLGPGKGFELAIRAMVEVARHVRGVRYVILGATHPEQRRVNGEAYRETLQALTADLGLSDTVELIDEFVEPARLGSWLQAADVYVTPYPGAEQIASGTLAFAIGAGDAIVSTPFSYAREILADGRGTLVPFGDPRAMGGAITRFLIDRGARDAARERAYAFGRSMIWQSVGARYAELFEELLGRETVDRSIGRSGQPVGAKS